MAQRRTQSRGPGPGGAAAVEPPLEVPFRVDRLRGDLYRLLDQLPRARANAHAALVREFEEGWEEFKRATAPRG